MTNELHSVYIPSLEASDIYAHMNREKVINLKFVGMIPPSLELSKLIEAGLVPFTQKKTKEKKLSSDVINVKFNQKARSGKQIISKVQAKLKKENIDPEYKSKLQEYLKVINPNWKEVKSTDLREELYEHGFTITRETKNGIFTDKYVVYKRSSSKSRKGECLFIKESLYDEMIKWSRLGLDFSGKIDYPSLLAYESLVGSSIEGTIEIHPENILLVSDIVDTFEMSCNVVKEINGQLKSVPDDKAKISNSLFDGESLLDSSYFPEGKSMKLLRNHMFKSAAFNCNIQDYFKANCPDLANYDNWMIPNMLGQLMLARNVHLIITPSSLKALKFSNTLGFSPAAECDLWEHWKKVVIADECKFGICKSEKESGRGTDFNGNIVNQLSYQMLNSLPASESDIDELVQFEQKYIDKLKNDDETFIDFVRKGIDSINSNAMMVDLYKKNKDIASTPLFKKFRTEEISAYVKRIKGGKLRLNADYAVLLGNPMEFLAHAIGRYNRNNLALRNNEIYTTMHPFEKDYVCFRNPHTSPSNVLIAKNVYNEDIEKYFNLTKNIVCVNAIDFPIQDTLSGADYDSDQILLCDHPKALELAEKCKEYKVVLNKVESSKTVYTLCKSDMAKIDNQLSKSQALIGEVVNQGQLYLSMYWDGKKKEKSEEELAYLMNRTDVMTVLSGISIDLAKKMYSIDIKKELSVKTGLGKIKPLFWEYVSKEGDVDTVKFDTPMDYLIEKMSDLDYADDRKEVKFYKFINDADLDAANRGQRAKIISYAQEMGEKLSAVKSKMNLSKKEQFREMDEIVSNYKMLIGRLKIKQNTMCAIVKAKNNKQLLSLLHKTHKDTFLSAIKS
ncbi:RNA dependent RNA polymerase [Paenibacillus anseongense]|uniref:RNA dependent RNA polymerase n=1 Tax=Paenibacillus anseongense TaxID=2682845 RepID=UPI002DBA0709|nr:hypothetical protein [Paenibacillus anseongense]MEC0265155.1 hypothetical protein [Paenibacillus anseongense]